MLGLAAQGFLLPVLLLYPEVSQEADFLVSRFARLGVWQIILAVVVLVQTSVLLDFLLNGAEGPEVRPEHQEVHLQIPEEVLSSVVAVEEVEAFYFPVHARERTIVAREAVVMDTETNHPFLLLFLNLKAKLVLMARHLQTEVAQGAMVVPQAVT